MNTRPISFPNWKVRLAQSSLSPSFKAAFTREILTFLEHRETRQTPKTIELAKHDPTWVKADSFGRARERIGALVTHYITNPGALP